MPRNAREIITEADRRFPIRIRVAVPPGGFGKRLPAIYEWLDASCGADGWIETPAGTRGVVNDAVAFYFDDIRVAAAFVARWCAGGKAEISSGTFSVREDEPTPRKVATPHG